MTISELIAELERIRDREGDLGVFCESVDGHTGFPYRTEPSLEVRPESPARDWSGNPIGEVFPKRLLIGAE